MYRVVASPRTDHGKTGADVWSCLFSQALFSAKFCSPAWPRAGRRYLDSTSPRLARTPLPFHLMAKVESTDDNLYDGNFWCSFTLPSF